MKLVMIAAAGRNREIGLDGDMPWKRALKRDLAYFKETTMGHPMVMGRKTWESLPKKMEGRREIVITRDPKFKDEHPDVQVYSSPKQFLESEKNSTETVYVIGGASLYRQLLPFADEILLTEIDSDFEADTYFPAADHETFQRDVMEELEDGGFNCRRVRYTRTER